MQEAFDPKKKVATFASPPKMHLTFFLMKASLVTAYKMHIVSFSNITNMSAPRIS